METLIEFIDRQRAGLNKYPRNSYVKQRGFKSLYVRYTTRCINGIIYERVLDIANVEVTKPGRGTFTRLIVMLKKKYPSMNIYVESVMSTRFLYYLLLEAGFVRDRATEPPAVSVFLYWNTAFKITTSK